MINNNIEYSYLLSDIMSKIGVEHACISPGARNSPLIYAFSQKSKINCYSHVDERSSAFFGYLGYGATIVYIQNVWFK